MLVPWYLLMSRNAAIFAQNCAVVAQFVCSIARGGAILHFFHGLCAAETGIVLPTEAVGVQIPQ